jgi:hypothetical protein
VFAKLLETILETIFNTSVSILVAFVVTSPALENSHTFRTHFSHGNKKKPDGEKSGEYGGSSKSTTLHTQLMFLSYVEVDGLPQWGSSLTLAWPS